MTAIAYSAGTMAADTQCVDLHVKWHSPKIVKHQGYLLGAAGECPPLADLVRWFFLAPGKPTRPKIEGLDFRMLVVTPRRQIQIWDNRGNYEPIRTKFWAIGAGAECCLAALDMGASAPEAVRKAIKFSEHCGGRVTTCKL